MGKLLRLCVWLLAGLFAALILYVIAAYTYSRGIADYQAEMAGWPERSEFGDPLVWKTDEPDTIRILSIQGGALFGLADLEVLKALEEQSGKPVHELFDFFAGASTGAIISTLLLHPHEKTGKPSTAEEAIDIYADFAKRILDVPIYHRILTGFGFFGPALRNEGRIAVAKEIFGDNRFNELLRPAMFPTYSQKSGGLKLFRNWDATEANLYQRSVLSAVTSVPTIFPAVVLTGEGADGGYYGDPALILNSPGEMAYLHARSNLPHLKKFVIVSLGTQRDFSIPDETAIDGGIMQWFVPIFQMIYQGEQKVSLETLERHAGFDSNIEVLSIELVPKIPPHSSSFDPSDDNIDEIRRYGRSFVSDNGKLLDKAVAILSGETQKTSP